MTESWQSTEKQSDKNRKTGIRDGILQKNRRNLAKRNSSMQQSNRMTGRWRTAGWNTPGQSQTGTWQLTNQNAQTDKVRLCKQFWPIKTCRRTRTDFADNFGQSTFSKQGPTNNQQKMREKMRETAMTMTTTRTTTTTQQSNSKKRVRVMWSVPPMLVNQFWAVAGVGGLFYT